MIYIIFPILRFEIKIQFKLSYRTSATKQFYDLVQYSTVMQQIDIISFATTTGGAIAIGGLFGIATKYLIKVMAFLLGLQIALVTYLQHISVISIEWSNISNIIDNIITAIQILSIPDGVSNQQLIETFGFFGGITVGFLVGYRVG